MARSTPASPKYKGIFWDGVNERVKVYDNGVLILGEYSADGVVQVGSFSAGIVGGDLGTSERPWDALYVAAYGAFGVDPSTPVATTGEVRLSYGAEVHARNSDDSDNITVLNTGAAHDAAVNAVRLAGNILQVWKVGTTSYLALIEPDGGTAASFQFSGTDEGVATCTISGASGLTLILDALPTSDPVVAGQVWNDAGTLKISAGA